MPGETSADTWGMVPSCLLPSLKTIINTIHPAFHAGILHTHLVFRALPHVQLCQRNVRANRDTRILQYGGWQTRTMCCGAMQAPLSDERRVHWMHLPSRHSHVPAQSLQGESAGACLATAGWATIHQAHQRVFPLLCSRPLRGARQLVQRTSCMRRRWLRQMRARWVSQHPPCMPDASTMARAVGIGSRCDYAEGCGQDASFPQ